MGRTSPAAALSLPGWPTNTFSDCGRREKKKVNVCEQQGEEKKSLIVVVLLLCCARERAHNELAKHFSSPTPTPPSSLPPPFHSHPIFLFSLILRTLCFLAASLSLSLFLSLSHPLLRPGRLLSHSPTPPCLAVLIGVSHGERMEVDGCPPRSWLAVT